jgi:histone H3/H4
MAKSKKNMDLSKRHGNKLGRAAGKTYAQFSKKAKDRVFKYMPLGCLQRISRQRQCVSVSKEAHGRVAELLADYVENVVRDAALSARSRGRKTITIEDANAGIDTARDRLNLKPRPVVAIV